MPIAATCPACRERYQLADEMAGKYVRCRKCQDSFEVPGRAGGGPAARSEGPSERDRPRSRDRDLDREDDLYRDEPRPRRSART